MTIKAKLYITPTEQTENSSYVSPINDIMDTLMFNKGGVPDIDVKFGTPSEVYIESLENSQLLASTNKIKSNFIANIHESIIKMLCDSGKHEIIIDIELAEYNKSTSGNITMKAILIDGFMKLKLKLMIQHGINMI